MDEQYYGYTEEQWEAMEHHGFAFLAGLARDRRDTDYSTFCRELRRRAGVAPDPHDHALRTLLGRIATRSYEDKQVVITALIHYKGGSEPGPGFYEVSERLRKANAMTDWRIPQERRLEFWVGQVQAAQRAYAAPERLR